IRFKLGKDGKPISAEADTGGDEMSRFIAEQEWAPTPAELKSFAGRWHSDEADASFTIAVEGEQAFFVQRPATRRLLQPQYKDHFTFGVGSDVIFWFIRDTSGWIMKLHAGASRMRDMAFERIAGN